MRTWILALIASPRTIHASDASARPDSRSGGGPLGVLGMVHGGTRPADASVAGKRAAMIEGRDPIRKSTAR